MELSSLFDQTWETAEGFRANCPRCGDEKGKLYINVEKGVGCCQHASCSWSPDKGGVTAHRLVAYFGKRPHEEISYRPPEPVEKSPDADVTLPDEYQQIRELPDDLAETLYAYLEYRGIGKRVVRRMRIGYCKKGTFWGYLIFPVFDVLGKVVYWQGRRFKKREPKFYDPKSSHKAELLYRVGNASWPKYLVVVESIMNALTLETDEEKSKYLVVALLGKSMSVIQRDQILAYERSVKRIIVALDGDARRDAVKVASKLYGSVPEVCVAGIPEGEDINSLGRDVSWNTIREAKRYSPDKEISLMAEEFH